MTARAEIEAMLVGRQRQLFGFALKLTRDRERARDLVQHAAVKALERSAEYVAGTNPVTWIYVLMRNEFLKQRRQAWRQTDDDVLQVIDLRTCVKGNQESAVELSEVAAAMGRLPYDQYTAIMLRCVEDLDEEEAACVADVPAGTMKSRLNRARAALSQGA